MNIPELPIDFASLASKGVSVLGSIAVAVAGVIVLGCLIFMGFSWIRRVFTDEVEVTTVIGNPDDWDYYQRNIEQIEGEFASYGDVDDIPV